MSLWIKQPRRRLLLVVAFLIIVLLFFFLHTTELITSTSLNNPKQDQQQQQHKPSTKETLEKEKKIIPVDFPDPFKFHTPTKGEKYITYLPHSGFHNQRIELENALLLAYYLNRTLLLPDVFLGNPAMPWLRFDKMYERILLQTKRGLDHCPTIEDGAPYPMECLNYHRWTQVPWTFFYDIKPLLEKVKIVLRPDLSVEWIQQNLHVQKKDIQFMKDNSPYEFRVYDHMESKTPLSKFIHRYDLSTLEAIKKPVLHFGSVFGTHRILAQQPDHLNWLKTIKTHLIFNNPALVDPALKAVQQLGGIGQYVGLHLRVGDGIFKLRSTINIDNIYHQLVDQFTDLTLAQLQQLDLQHDDDQKERTDYEVKNLRKVSDISSGAPLTLNHPSQDMSQVISRSPPATLASHLKCRQFNNNNKEFPGIDTTRFSKTVIYIATDAPNPKKNPLFKKIYDTFPCVFDLSDFGFVFEELDQIYVEHEKVKLDSYLIPMLDAIISAHGHSFFGTNDSTFTSYIERQLHPVYTQKDVILRGPPAIYK